MKKHEIIQSKHVDHIENEKLILSKMDHPFSVSLDICNLLLPRITFLLSYPNLYRTFSSRTMDFSKTIDTFTSRQSS